LWKDESTNGNDLTQATSANQPKLVEDNTVTQFTASNQPTYDQVSGVDVMAFDSDNFEAIGVFDWDNDWSLDFDVEYVNNGLRIVSLGANSATSALFSASSSQIRLQSNENNQFNFSISDGTKRVTFIKNGNDLSAYSDGALAGTQDFTGNTFSANYIGATQSTVDFRLYSLRYYKIVVSDPTNIVETPDFTLTPDPTKMRTSANANPVLGEDVAKWYAQEHNPYQNEVVFDGTDDNISGLPTQSIDFTYVWEVEHSALSTTDYIFSSSGTPSALLLLSDNYYYLRDTTGSGDIGLTFHAVEAGLHTYALVRSGDNVSLYVDSVFKQTVDVTGRTYTWDTVGDSADSLGGGLKRINVYDRALTQDEINWFSYLRDQEGNILQPPLLPS
jgi:hypothetical protein